VLIAGKDLSPYLVPQKMKFTCDMSFGKAFALLVWLVVQRKWNLI